MRIIVVGSGISACVTTWQLCQAGHQVTLVSKGPDPRKVSQAEHFSATWNGAGARFVTPLEARPYTDREKVFERTVFEGGWLTQPQAHYRGSDQAWLERRQEAHRKQSSQAWDYYRVQGPCALSLWRQWISDHPELFSNVDLCDRPILRLYDDHSLCSQAQHDYDRALIPYETVDIPPRLDNDSYQGALTVGGFTFNAQTFIINLLDQFDAEEVMLHWNRPITAILRNSHDEVTGLATPQGPLVADSYILNLGAYGYHSLFDSVTAPIGGIAGRWLLVSGVESWRSPLKLHGASLPQRQAFDLSLVPLTTPQSGTPFLAVGGGFVFLGSPPYTRQHEHALEYIDRQHRAIVQALFGKNLQIKPSPLSSLCIRAFSTDDTPLCTTLPCAGGGSALLQSGTNTGTTALAPILAEQVLAALMPTHTC